MYLQVTGCSFFRCDMPQEKHWELLCFCNLLYCLIRICLSKKQLKQQLSKGHKYLSINASAPEFKQSFKKKKAREMPGCSGYLIIWAGGVAGQTTRLTDQPRVQACWQMSVWGDSPTPQHQGNQFIVSLNRPLLFIKIHYVMDSHLSQFLWPRKSTGDNSKMIFRLHDNFFTFSS